MLFIGNSYTRGIKGQLIQLVAASPYKNCTLSFIHTDGRTLEEHFENHEAMDRIRNGSWDVVVIQEQSQLPSLLPDKFMDAAKEIDVIIDDSGAETFFFETWGRRDGDQKNAERLPDFETMQKATSRAYERVARRCRGVLIPVGQAWAILRDDRPELWNQLYKTDGSHPAPIGGYLAACVFYTILFDADPAEVNYDGGFKSSEVEAIYAAAREATR